jgi:hypothetical protein
MEDRRGSSSDGVEIGRVTGPDRLLYVPNEVSEGDQYGPLACFRHLHEQGRLSAYRAVSILPEVRGCGTERAWTRLLDAAAETRPTLVLLQHLAGSGVGPQHFRALRRAAPDAVIAYHEADAYGVLRKPLPIEARAAGRHADVTFVSGTGSLVRNFRRAGARRILYSPQAYDSTRFGRLSTAGSGRTAGVVMIANNTTENRSFRGLPGARARARLVELAARAFGDDFTVYGHGWRVPQAAGPLRYDDQEFGYQQGKVAINWDHFPREPGYYSDRLPTCMASATPQVTTWHALLEHQIPAGNGVFFARRPEQVLEIAARLLARPSAELAQLGARARGFATAHLRQDQQYEAMLDRMTALRPPRS